MSSVNFWNRWLVLTCVLAFGCNSQSSNTASSTSSAANSSEEGGEATAVGDGANAKKKIVPVKRNVKDIEGNWVVVATSNRRDSYRWIINFSRGSDGKIVGQFVDTSQDKDEAAKPEVVSTEVEGDLIKINVKNAHGAFDFVGTFQQGFIRGTIKTNPFELVLTRLLPTDEKSLEKYGIVGFPPASDVYENLMKSKDVNAEKLLTAMQENRTSPVTQDMFAMLMASHGQAKLDEAKLQEIIDAYLSAARLWGDRWVARIEMSIAANLINGRQFPQLAPSHLDAAEKLLGDDLADMKEMLQTYREAANVSICIQQIMSESSTDAVRAARYTELTELLKKQPYNAEILYALATQAERTGQIDEAIEYLSDIVALPMLEMTILRVRAGQPPNAPSELLKKLWIQKKGSEDGCTEHVSELYHQKIESLLAEIQQKGPVVPAADAGNKTVLVELFTGIQCPPCVSPDVALSALGKTFPSTEVIVIRCHQHLPGPDGLVNQDSEERAAFYEINSTPTVVIDGIAIDPRFYAGPIQSATGAYGLFRKVVDPRLSEKTEIGLQLSATVTDGQLSASAEVTGVPEDLLPSCRLRMAIVENRIDAYVPLMTNGIREHEFVVREMLGGSKGIPPKKGELKYSITIPVADINQHVIDYIARYEAGRRAEFPVKLKPPIQGPLSLVAWVQNGTLDKESNSKLVLQSAMIPFAGETGFAAPQLAEPNSEKSTTTSKSSPKVDAGSSAPEVAPSAPSVPE